MDINSVTNNGYKHTETISMQKASDRYKETYRSVPKRMDSLEISSEAYEMRNKDEKMSATSGKDTLGITRGDKENTFVIHFSDSAMVSRVKYLGYAFYRYKGKCRFRVHPKSVEKMKDKIRGLTKRNNGGGNEYRAMKLTQFVRGWVNYFSLADMKGLLRETDEWLRHKIRTIYWKQWKKAKTKPLIKRLATISTRNNWKRMK